MVEEVAAKRHEVKMQPLGDLEALPEGQIMAHQTRPFQDVDAGIPKPSDVGGIRGGIRASWVRVWAAGNRECARIEPVADRALVGG